MSTAIRLHAAIHTKHVVRLQRRAPYSMLASLKRIVNRTPASPPTPTKVPDIQLHHGKKRIDNFSWMEQLDHPDLVGYIQAENEQVLFTKQSMSKAAFLKRAVLSEMKKRLHVPRMQAPLSTVAHGYEYYSRTSPYGMVYLRKKLGESKEEVLLNAGFLRSLNMSIRKVLLSPDHNIFAYNTETEGMEYGDLHLKDLHKETQGEKNETLHDVFNFVWANNETVYYTVPNEQLRPYRVYAHRIGTAQEDDVLVYEETDDTVFVDITSTKDMKYVTINSNSLSSSEIRVVDATHDYATSTQPHIQLVQPREKDIEYYVDHHKDTFYILTNADGATNFKLARMPDNMIGREHWQDVITMAENEKIEDVDVFQNHLVIYGRRDGLPMILCHDLSTQETYPVELPERFCVLQPGTNLDFDTEKFRFSIHSPFAHESTYDYDMSSRRLTSVRVQPIHRFDRSKYACTRVYSTSHDGTKVPITLIHRKDMELHGRNPVLMRGYGAYGVSTEPQFRIENFPLLERGWVIALAHVRGGSELGRQWYEHGKLEHKMNSFHDFISVAEHLIKSKVTSPEYLSAMGTSAGGLLVGAMLHLRPDLFKALVLRVPFVDPLSSMLNPELPLTQVEYPEWGNPTDDPSAYDLIQSYSPYDNVQGLNVPATYVTAGMKDQRVAYWQPLKLVAKLRDMLPSPSSSSVLLKVDLDRGHFGGGAEQEIRLSEVAEQVAFLISRVQKT
ncbi:oligopeptidase b [Lichtheimia corymbifera JMRC:FSU:9682]|uniref:Prolyl endopeptidase n=1 Tax=Lichtheimia corymbifera JMRC:FSU:9682 TaxID=1263082 RepID=A0A068RTJ7_9FUNG|nr:oligopeptidase b [Lichtheimia corymbifera JMRC:FSU:9682]